MIERWIDTGGKLGGAWQRALRRRMALVPAGLWVMALAVLLAAARPVWCSLRTPSNLDAIAEETGSISYMFYRNGIPFGYRDAFGLHADSPQLNHAGTQLAYCTTSDNGGGLFLRNLASGEQTLVFEEMATNFYNGPSTELSVHAWSPDDTKFIYSRHGRSLVLYEPATGGELPFVNLGSPVALAWLTAQSLVCVTKYGAGPAFVHVIKEQPDGKWKELGPAVKAGFDGLSVLSTNTIAWKRGGCVWGLNLDSKAVTLLCQPPPGQSISGFDFCAETGQFLLKCDLGNQSSLWLAEPRSAECQPTQLKSSSIRLARWLNGGKGYAYVDGANQLVVQTETNSAPVRLFELGRVDSFAVSADGRRLAVTAIASNEPSFGIWEYDVPANSLKCVVPCAQRGLAHVRPAFAQRASIPGPAGRRLGLVIYKPVVFDRHKKYPVVIANTPFFAAQPYMKQYALAVANAGGYFVILDRLDWFNKMGFQDAWSENEPCVINYLSDDPTIDRKRVFLVSNCIESNFLKDFAGKHPGGCAGAIMFIANSLPEPADFISASYAPRLLISTCDAWEGKGERMKKYQETACQSGVEVTYLVHSNTKHDFVSMQSQRERIRAMLHLVFDQ